MNHLKPILAALVPVGILLAAAAWPCAAQSPHAILPIVNFGQAADRAIVSLRGGVIHEGDAGRYVFQKWAPGKDQWPALVVSLWKGKSRNWSDYDDLALIASNPSDRDVSLSIHLQDSEWATETRRVVLQPGPNLVEFPLDETRYVNPGWMREVHLFMTRPEEDTPLEFGSLFLRERLDRRLATAREALGAVAKEAADDGFPRLLNDVTERGATLVTRLDAAAGAEARQALRPEVLDIEAAACQSAPRRLSEARMRRASARIFPAAPYALGFAGSMEKVFPKDIPVEATVAREGHISLAGNETEALQLLILAGKDGLNGVQVDAGPLKRIGGTETLQPTTAPMGFVQTKKPPYRADYVGWYPDPILDFLKTFDVKPDEMQPVWVSVKTPTGAKPGEYRGTLTVRAANAPPQSVALRVTVWGFDLPRQTHLRTALTYNPVYVKQVYGTLTTEMNRRYEDFLLAHRLNPDNIYRYDPPAAEDVVRWANEGMNAFNITYVVKPKDLKPNAPYPAEAKAKIMDTLARVIPQYKAAGVYDKAYVYGFDEVNADSYNAMRDVLDAIRAKYPDLPILTTARDETYGEASHIAAVSDWVPLTDRYDPARAEQARAKGKKVWWYTCIVPKAPYANWLIEYPAIDARMLMGLQTAKYRPDGYLYYALNRWPLSKKPITDGPYTDWPTWSFGEANGDGSVLCAGPDGPLSTIRLENITDGIEDNEYWWLLRREDERLAGISGERAARARKRVEGAIAIGDNLVRSLNDFSKDPAALQAKRRQAAEAIVSARRVVAN